MSLTYAIVRDEIEAAFTYNDLMAAGGLIQFVADVSDRHRLDGIFKKRLEAIKAK